MEQFMVIDTHVYGIPGGKEDALRVYQQCAAFLQKQPMQFVVYRVQDHEGKWLLVLIGAKEDFIRYQTHFQHFLSDVHAQSSDLPPKTLAMLVQRFLVLLQEMERTQQTFIERHRRETLDGDQSATS